MNPQLSKTPAQVVFRAFNPHQMIEFLVSFVLSFGRYETELDLFSSGSLLNSYVTAKLLEDTGVYSDTDVLKIS